MSEKVKRVAQLGQFGGILPGPTSEPDENSGHDWLDARVNAGTMDAAFNANDRQKHMAEVGEHQWSTGAADSAPHPRSGVMVNTGESKHLDQPIRNGPGPIVEHPGPLNFNIQNEDAPGSNRVVGQERVKHLYRGMSEGEFQQAKGRGYIASDERGVIMPGWEGTNATPDYGSANYYLPHEGPGRVVKIAVNPDDQWFTSSLGDYPRTRAQIPWDRVISHTSQIDQSKSSDLRGQVLEQQKKQKDA